MRKGLLSLLRRRVETELQAGTPPAKTLEILKQMVEGTSPPEERHPTPPTPSDTE